MIHVSEMISNIEDVEADERIQKLPRNSWCELWKTFSTKSFECTTYQTKICAKNEAIMVFNVSQLKKRIFSAT